MREGPWPAGGTARTGSGPGRRRAPAFAASAAVAVLACLAAGLAPSCAGASAKRPSPQRDAARPEGGVRHAAVAVGARASEAGGVTRLALDLSARVAFQTTLARQPRRLIVDLPDVNFQIDPAVGRLDGKGVGLIRGFRFGSAGPGRSRVVVDLDGPAALRRADVVSIAGGDPSRLILELVPADPASAEDAPGEPAPRVAAAAAAPDGPRARPVVVIDPGHGGIDPGAGGPVGAHEKDVVLDFAQALAVKLSAGGRYRVVLTRGDDRFVSLADRVRVARDADAALFISVHADMLADAAVAGATVYTVSDRASDAEAARVAAAENRADEVAGGAATAPGAPDVAGILFDLARHETRTYAHQFQHTLTGYWAKVARLNRNPERAAGFKVLQAPDVPSVLLELGYLSSDKDRAALTSPDWRDRAAGAVAGAVDGFFAARSVEPAPTSAPAAAAMR